MIRQAILEIFGDGIIRFSYPGFPQVFYWAQGTLLETSKRRLELYIRVRL